MKFPCFFSKSKFFMLNTKSILEIWTCLFPVTKRAFMLLFLKILQNTPTQNVLQKLLARIAAICFGPFLALFAVRLPKKRKECWRKCFLSPTGYGDCWYLVIFCPMVQKSNLLNRFEWDLWFRVSGKYVVNVWHKIRLWGSKST